jgi:nucleoside-diphosphate-sugar epimerase
MTTVFVTGGAGFLGSRVVNTLLQCGIPVVALDRSGSMQPSSGQSGSLKIVRGDLLAPATYAEELAQSSVVVHLAALTGRASREEHFRANTQATETLLDECRRSGVQRILFVSSIAAKFPDDGAYYYAQAKVRAEEAVRKSKLRFTIVRPTIILGRGAPILGTLEKLANLPVIPIFGNGKTSVQPIYVDDLANFILTIVEEDLFNSEIVELGGPSAISMEALIQEIRQVRRGSRGPSIHVPLGPLRAALNLAETIGLGGLLPVSAGQLSSFRYDGTILSNPLHERRRSTLRDVPQMLALSMAA